MVIDVGWANRKRKVFQKIPTAMRVIYSTFGIVSDIDVSSNTGVAEMETPKENRHRLVSIIQDLIA